jgi:hypothetical protein
MTFLNRDGYMKLIDEDLKWLLKQARSLERDHIKNVLTFSVDLMYPKRGTCDLMNRMDDED